ncbi:MAG: hypothetical protein MI757_05070 [Pirellulales bacterium]|nr:hypothetical protein [Pirellulales bacterium]
MRRCFPPPWFFHFAFVLCAIATGLHAPHVALAQTTLEVRVEANNDDAEESDGGGMSLNNDKLELGQMKWVGFRFNNVTIPQGATISTAYVDMRADDSNTESTDLTIFGEDADDAAAIGSGNNNLSNRTRTTASVTWNNVANWNKNTHYQTPEIKAIVEEIVGRSGWASGNDLVILIRSDDLNGKRFAVSHDGQHSKAPLLHVEYTEGSGGGSGDDSGGGPTVARVLLSTVGVSTLGGLTIQDEDVAEYTTDTDTATMFLDTSVDIQCAGGSCGRGSSNDINALFVRDNGNIVFSPNGNIEIDGTTYGDDDLIEYNPTDGTATLLFDGRTLFSNSNEDINAVHILDNGNIILSTVANATLGGLTFGDDDLVEYDPNTDTATMFFDGGALFSNTSEDIDAVYITEEGTILLSTIGNATLGGLTFGDDDIVEYDPVADTATIYLDGATTFTKTNEDIDAIHIRYITAGNSAYWKLDESTGTTANDSSGNGWDATLTGFSFDTASTAACVSASGLSFDGLNDELAATGNTGITGVAARSVSAWIKTTTTGAIVSWGAANAGEEWTMRVQDDDGAEGALRVDVGSGYVVGTTDLRDDAWHLVVAVLPDGFDNATDVLLYVDGVLETVSASQSQTINTADATDIKIGNDLSNRYFTGSMSDVQVYDRDLAASEVTQLYGLVAYWKFDESDPATVAVDATGNGYDVTLNGDAAWANGKKDGALTFDGSGDFAVTSINFDPPDDGAISFWMKVPAAQTGTRRILGTSSRWEVRHNASGIITFDINNAGARKFETTTAVDTINRWYHIAANFSASTEQYEIYIDGVLHKSGTDNQTPQGEALLSIGRRTRNNNFWNGTIDDLRIYSRWLCADEVTQLSSSEPTVGVRVLKWVEVK